MKKENRHLAMSASLAVALLLSLGITGLGCDKAKEVMDNFDSRAACHDYCAKSFSCKSHEPTSDETNTCVDACRRSIEDDCGNEHQAAANDQIKKCVDKSCLEFWGCMVFGAAPECFGFVKH